MSQYVCLRIVRMDDVNIALFEHDRNNTLYFYLFNADEQIYMRYGGRDSKSPDTYLNLASLELALKQGLELHQKYLAGGLQKKELPKPMYPREIPLLVERTFARGQCVECHLIGDFQNLHREQNGTLDKLVHLWRSPDIKTIGILLDVPKGLVVKEAQGAALAAGMKAGDRIRQVEGTDVWTFADLQHHYDKVKRDAKEAHFTVERDGVAVPLTISLPVRWWWTDLRFRQSSIEPRIYFEDRALTAEEKQKYGLPADSFASQVKFVPSTVRYTKAHELEAGDVIASVDGVSRDELANTAELFIKLRRTPGDSMRLDVIRNGKHVEMPLRSSRMSFRK